jgi:hypothetical protein
MSGRNSLLSSKFLLFLLFCVSLSLSFFLSPFSPSRANFLYFSLVVGCVWVGCMGWFGLVFLPKVGLDATGSFFQQILGEVWLDKGGCILGDGHVFLLILFFFLLPLFFLRT